MSGKIKAAGPIFLAFLLLTPPQRSEPSLIYFSTGALSQAPQVSGNPVVQALIKRLAEERVELSQAMVVYGKNHPSVKKLQSVIDELQWELNQQRLNRQKLNPCALPRTVPIPECGVPRLVPIAPSDLL
jgi:hypothetical protein